MQKVITISFFFSFIGSKQYSSFGHQTKAVHMIRRSDRLLLAINIYTIIYVAIYVHKGQSFFFTWYPSQVMLVLVMTLNPAIICAPDTDAQPVLIRLLVIVMII